MTFIQWFNGFKSVINGIVNAFGRAFQLFFSDFEIFGIPFGYYIVFASFVCLLFAFLNKGD